MTSDRQIRFWLIGLVLLGLTLYALRGVLLPFVAGMAIAYILDPVVDRLEHIGLTRTLATALITGIFFFTVVSLFLLLAPLVEKQIVELAHQLPHYVDTIRTGFTAWVQKLEMQIEPADAERLRAAAGDFAGKVVSWFGQVLSGLWSGGLALVNIVSLVVITPVVSFYLLRDWDRLIERLDQWLPRDHAATIRDLFRQIDRTLSGFARGQALVSLFLGVFYAVGLSIVGLNFALVIGIVAGILSFIPFVGTAGGLVTSLGLAFLQFSDWRWIAATAGVFVLGNLIEGNFLQPRLVGSRVGLHPVWIIFALLAGGALLGFLGVLLAVPSAATIGVLARFALSRYLASPFYGAGGGKGPGGPDAET